MKEACPGFADTHFPGGSLHSLTAVQSGAHRAGILELRPKVSLGTSPLAGPWACRLPAFLQLNLHSALRDGHPFHPQFGEKDTEAQGGRLYLHKGVC